jgi:5-(carboxyamino)imidazole ribonucleotide synthase
MRRSLLPGATIGIFGGGQLGRMTAMAARELGYHIRVLDPDPSCAARFVVEKISLGSLVAAEKFAPVRPSSEVLGLIQDRGVQKQFLAKHGFPLGPFRVVEGEAQYEAAVRELGGKTFLKATRGGYDGRDQAETRVDDDAKEAFKLLGGAPAVCEKALDLEAELSVLVARSPSGEVVVYPPALNHHERRILAWSVLPAPFDETLTRRACDIARQIAEAMSVVGLLVVEMFVVNGDLLVNELAPRPHNSFHATSVGCRTSQFEQHTRAICDLPLGAPDVLRPAAIVNLLGDLWSGGAPDFDEALRLPGVRLHLYGKREARPGRKMGHLSATGNTSDDAVAHVRAAYARLTSSHAAR